MSIFMYKSSASFFLNDTAATEIYTLSLHDALPILRVGRVEAIRLAPGNWVEADLKIYTGITLPPKPAVIAASASLFGEWAATLISSDPLPSDPNVSQALI